jgi:RHS repeat-associated protein
VLSRMSYTPYGQPTMPMDGVGYTGHFIDVGTQLTYMQQRYYDPQVGRFLSTDPMPTHANTAWNFNRYNYAANNPYRFTDPDGRVRYDENGSVTFVSTGETVQTQSFVADDSVTQTTMQGESGHIYADDGTEIEAFRFTSADITVTTNTGTSTTTRIESDSGNLANCHGTTFASGQVWINDSQVASLLKGDGYQVTTSPTTQDVGVFSDNGRPESAVHSVTVLTVGERGVQTVGGKDNLQPYQITTPQNAWTYSNATLNYYQKP